jgi:hypothetical protein
MSFTNQVPEAAVTIMKAAVLAKTHISSIYKQRAKLGAFQRDGVWMIPLESLRNYVERRSARAREVLTPIPTLQPDETPRLQNSL